MDTGTLDPSVLAAIKRDYCQGTLSMIELAAKYQCTRDDLRHLRQYFRWPARNPDRATAALPPGFVPRLLRRDQPKLPIEQDPPIDPDLPIDDVTTSDSVERRLVDRLYRAIERQLDRMERRMELTKPQAETPADAERGSRSVGNLIKSYEKVRTLEHDLAAAGKHGTAGGSTEDAERKRRELAERIRKVRERIAGAEGGAG